MSGKRPISRRLPWAALVVAVLALFIALGGPSAGVHRPARRLHRERPEVWNEAIGV